MIFFKKIIFYIIVGFIFLGCTKNLSIPTPSKSQYNSMIKIVKYKNTYETVLGTFGDSLSQFTKLKYQSLKDINIEIYEVINKSADNKLPFSVQGMLIESISSLTETSGTFFVPKKIMIDDKAVTQADDYDKYSKYVSRVLQIEGSIDRSDVIYSKSNSFSGEAGISHNKNRMDLGFSRKNDDNIREISLSLRFINKMNGRGFGSYARYGSVSNSIRIFKKVKGSGYGVFLFGSGINSNVFRTITPGVHQAINILVQHSVIQIFGRYFEVPYWHSLDIYEVDKVQKNNMRIDWKKKSYDEKIKATQLVLNMYGFSIPMNSKIEKNKKLALKKTFLAFNAIKKYLGISGNIQNFNYYFSLYNNMPFARFLPKNYNNLKSEIIYINNGKLPSYKDPDRKLPKLPKPIKQPSMIIIRGDGRVDRIYNIIDDGTIDGVIRKPAIEDRGGFGIRFGSQMLDEFDVDNFHIKNKKNIDKEEKNIIFRAL